MCIRDSPDPERFKIITGRDQETLFDLIDIINKHDRHVWTRNVIVPDINDTEADIEAVSYTHLDVYKRQALRRGIFTAILALNSWPRIFQRIPEYMWAKWQETAEAVSYTHLSPSNRFDICPFSRTRMAGTVSMPNRERVSEIKSSLVSLAAAES